MARYTHREAELARKNSDIDLSRADLERLRQVAHRQRLNALLIGHAQGGEEHLLGVQRGSLLGAARLGRTLLGRLFLWFGDHASQLVS